MYGQQISYAAPLSNGGNGGDVSLDGQLMIAQSPLLDTLRAISRYGWH
jgi:hypothetical protein